MVNLHGTCFSTLKIDQRGHFFATTSKALTLPFLFIRIILLSRWYQVDRKIEQIQLY